MFVEDFFGYLSADPGVSGIVGTKIYFGNAPEGTVAPYIDFHKMHGDSKLTLEGLGQTPEQFFEIRSKGPDLTTATLLSLAVQLAIEGFRGFMGATDVLGIFVHSDGRDGYDEDRLQFYVAQDYKIWFRQVQAGGAAGSTPIATLIGGWQTPAEFFGDGVQTTFNLPVVPSQILGVFRNGFILGSSEWAAIGAAVTPVRLLQGGSQPDTLLVLYAA